MKIVITESQNMDLLVRRRMSDIVRLFEKKMTLYPPCDYKYDIYGFDNYYADIKHTIVDYYVTKEGWDWLADDDKIEKFITTIDELIYPLVTPFLKPYFDDILDAGCEDY